MRKNGLDKHHSVLGFLFLSGILRIGAISTCNFIFFYSKRGFDVKSYGSGTHVKLPGSAPDKPNVYTFDTTYEEMYKDLLRRDSNLYPGIKFRSF